MQIPADPELKRAEDVAKAAVRFQRWRERAERLRPQDVRRPRHTVERCFACKFAEVEAEFVAAVKAYRRKR